MNTILYEWEKGSESSQVRGEIDDMGSLRAELFQIMTAFGRERRDMGDRKIVGPS